MKKLLFILLAVQMIALTACDSDDCTCSGEIYGKWEVEQFLSVESRTYSKDNDYNPIIEFNEDGTILIFLDANSCFTNFEIDDENGISISDAGCTLICCDSDFSLKFVSMLSEVSSFNIESGQLKLVVPEWGWMVLNPVSN